MKFFQNSEQAILFAQVKTMVHYANDAKNVNKDLSILACQHCTAKHCGGTRVFAQHSFTPKAGLLMFKPRPPHTSTCIYFSNLLL